MTAIGKKLPPSISSGNTSTDVAMLALFLLLKNICNAANQAEIATPDVAIHSSDDGSLTHGRSW